MKVAILGSRSGWHEVRLHAALRAHGAEPLIAPVTALAARLGDGPRSRPARSRSTRARR